MVDSIAPTRPVSSSTLPRRSPTCALVAKPDCVCLQLLLDLFRRLLSHLDVINRLLEIILIGGDGSDLARQAAKDFDLVPDPVHPPGRWLQS